MEFTRTFDLLTRIKELYPEKSDALAGKENGKWILYSTEDYINHCNWVSYALLSMGIKKGDKVAIISNNRPEWIFTDLGISQIGAISVPVYPTISADEYAYILGHAEPKIVFVSDNSLFEKVRPIVDSSPGIFEIFSYNKLNGARHFSELIKKGKESVHIYAAELDRIKASINASDLVTIIYTSGTTGYPKGVMLRHSNLVSNFMETSLVHPLGSEARVLSFLPLSHILERMLTYHFHYKGMSIYYAENMGTIVDNLKEVNPEIFATVPRLLERIYDKIISKGKDLTGIKRRIFFWSVKLGLRYELNGKNGLLYAGKLWLANKLVFSKWREALGGNIRIIVSGGAALQPRLARIFWAANITVIEGYGLTETSPVIAVNNLITREVMFGTVGPILKDIEVRIADDGEILSKGPNLMAGYYREPQLTEESIDPDGWFHTGDVGEIIDGKYLRITDRKKEIFKLSSGKYIAPQVIENKLKESMFIEQVMVIGENQKFASAIIVPDFIYLHNWASIHHVSFTNNNDLAGNPVVFARFQKEVNELNQLLGDHEKIKRFRIVPDEWNMLTGELSPTLKLKRNVLYEKYKTLINEIFLVDKK